MPIRLAFEVAALLASVIVVPAVSVYAAWAGSTYAAVAVVCFSLGVAWNDWVGDLRRRLIDLAQPWGTAFHD